MRRRLLIVLLSGVVVAGGTAVVWQARAQARLVERDLTAARDLLGQAGGFSAGKLEERLALELDHFLECCRTGARPRTDGWNGVRVVATLEAAQRSLDKGGIQVEVDAPTR